MFVDNGRGWQNGAHTVAAPVAADHDFPTAAAAPIGAAGGMTFLLL